MSQSISALVFALAALAASAQTLPPAIFTDPPADKAYPAQMTVLHIPSHGVAINGLIYRPSGAGPHPTLVICHGLPGNEKNLDLAQAVRRAGWNAVAFNYRGSWGSPGSFRFAQNLEDADAVLAYLREPANASSLGIDTAHIVLAGHSMGGWVTAHTAAHDHALMGAILISVGDMGSAGMQPRAAVVADMADNLESLAGATAETMADELIANAKAFRMINAAPGLVNTPLLALTSDDGLTPGTDALVQAIRNQGGKAVVTHHVATDHGWSDHRIALEALVIDWLQALLPEGQIRALRAASNAAIQRQDIKAFAETLDTDFMAIRGNGVPIPSRQAYIELFTQDFADSKSIRYERIPDKIDISRAAPLASEEGHWTGVRQDGTRAYGGTYLAMWRKTGDTWKLRSELFVVLTCDENQACAAYRK